MSSLKSLDYKQQCEFSLLIWGQVVGETWPSTEPSMGSFQLYDESWSGSYADESF